ncbi:ASST-domain-containing protein [Mycena epipterygia]|nr:ASST-domain-containing protein [Mycena epipterygia]
MRGLYTAGALAASLFPRVHALFETTYHSSSLALQPFTILDRSPDYDPDNTTLFLVCPAGGDVAQPGPTIYKSTGELDQGRPPLAQEGSGIAVMLNSHYEIVMNVSAVNPPGTDLHEFNIVKPENKTTLVTAFNTIPLELTSVGGPAKGFYANSIIQEIDIATGRVLFNWTSVDYIALNESFNNISLTHEGSSSSNAWDAVHINSIDKETVLTIPALRTARATIPSPPATARRFIKSTRTAPSSGASAGNSPTSRRKPTTPRFTSSTTFGGNGDTQISVFDDGAATLLRAEVIDELPLAPIIDCAPNLSVRNFSLAVGSVEPYGDTVLVSYRSNPWVEAYDTDSENLLFSAIMGPNNASLWLGGIDNYRAFTTSTLQFTGLPTQPPNVSVTDGDVYVSWNGATHVAQYTLLTGSAVDAVSTKVLTVAKDGFETKMSAAGSSTFISVAALAANGTTLGTSAVYKTSDGTVASR